MPPKACIPSGLVPGDLISVKFEQKHDVRQKKGVIFNWTAIVDQIEPLLVRFQCDEKLGQKHPEPLPFPEKEEKILHEIKIMKTKKVVLAPPPPVNRRRVVKVFNGSTFSEVDPEWAAQIERAHSAFLKDPQAPSKFSLNHYGVVVMVDLKNRSIGELKQVLQIDE